jgi:hypothetical protein
LGAYADVLIRRYHNEIGRAMWDFRGAPRDDPRFLVVVLTRSDSGAPDDPLLGEWRRYLVGGYEDRVIQRGPLLSDDGSAWVGTVTIVELADRDAVEAMVRGDPCAGRSANVEIHDWQFGGRQ